MFSWHMMLKNRTGTTVFVLRNPSNGKTQDIDPGDYLSYNQLLTMTGNPDLTVQFAHYLSDRAQHDLHLPTKPQVFVRTMISLNLRPPQQYIDPNLDLARVQLPLIGHQSWITPLRPRPPHSNERQSTKELNRSASASAG